MKKQKLELHGTSLQKPCKQEERGPKILSIGEKNHQPRILYSAKLFFNSEKEIKTLRQTKTEKNSCWQTCLTRNVQRNPS